MDWIGVLGGPLITTKSGTWGIGPLGGTTKSATLHPLEKHLGKCGLEWCYPPQISNDIYLDRALATQNQAGPNPNGAVHSYGMTLDFVDLKNHW